MLGRIWGSGRTQGVMAAIRRGFIGLLLIIVVVTIAGMVINQFN